MISPLSFVTNAIVMNETQSHVQHAAVPEKMKLDR